MTLEAFRGGGVSDAIFRANWPLDKSFLFASTQKLTRAAYDLDSYDLYDTHNLYSSTIQNSIIGSLESWLFKYIQKQYG